MFLCVTDEPEGTGQTDAFRGLGCPQGSVRRHGPRRTAKSPSGRFQLHVRRRRAAILEPEQGRSSLRKKSDLTSIELITGRLNGGFFLFTPYR